MRLLKKNKKVYCLISKKKYLVAERNAEIEKLHNSANFQNLIYHFKDPTKDIAFNDFIDAETLFDDIKSKIIRTEDVEKNQSEFESKLSSVRKNSR